MSVAAVMRLGSIARVQPTFELGGAQLFSSLNVLVGTTALLERTRELHDQ